LTVAVVAVRAAACPACTTFILSKCITTTTAPQKARRVYGEAVMYKSHSCSHLSPWCALTALMVSQCPRRSLKMIISRQHHTFDKPRLLQLLFRPLALLLPHLLLSVSTLPANAYTRKVDMQVT
jgi:hypothetical protein